MLKRKNGAKLMLTVNLDIQGLLINDQTGNINHIEFAQGSVWKAYVRFSNKKASLKVFKSSNLCRKNYGVPIEKWKVDIPIKKGSASPSIKRAQFLLILT